jgi:predicted lipid-binding transport protein (Tim44 family)
VGRVIGIPSLLVVLVIGGYLMTKQMQSSGPSSPAVQQEVAQAQSAAAQTNFSQADASMQASFAENNTYFGAALPAGSGVVLVSATATSYCLQAAGEHEDGPGGTVQPGGC